jgi:hypothetical protein
MLNVGRRTVQQAAAVRTSAIPSIIDAVRQGHMPVSRAAQVAKLPPSRQQHAGIGARVSVTGRPHRVLDQAAPAPRMRG